MEVNALDIALRFDEDLQASDLVLDSAGPQIDQTLKTGIVLSLLCDARLPDDMELPPGETDRRGWCLDFLGDGEEEEDRYGSLLWTLRRAKQTPETLRLAKLYCEEALAWLTKKSFVESLTVETEFTSRHVMAIRVYVDDDLDKPIEIPFKMEAA